MLEEQDVVRVLDIVAKNLVGVGKNSTNFKKLPDSYWGYFARGHDQKGKFGIIVTYSEKGSDVDELIRMYEEWVSKNKTIQENS